MTVNFFYHDGGDRKKNRTPVKALPRRSQMLSPFKYLIVDIVERTFVKFALGAVLKLINFGFQFNLDIRSYQENTL